MLTNNTLSLAMSVARNMFNQNKIVHVHENTPLAHLVSCVVRDSETIALESVDAVPAIIEDTANFKLPNERHCYYDQEADQMIAELANKLREHIGFIRKTVNPYVGDIVAKIRDAEQHRTAPELEGLNILIKSQPKLLTNNSFLSLVERFADTQAPTVIATKVKFPQLSGEEVSILLDTGSTEIDNEIREITSSLDLIGEGSNTLGGVFASIFMNQALRPTDVLGINKENALEKAIIGFLIANKLLSTDPIEGVVGKAVVGTANEYKDTLIAIRGACGFFIRTWVEINERNLRTNNLLVSVRRGQAVVNGPVYERWLQNGGDADVLLGNILRDQPYRYMHEIEANKEQLLKNWKTHSKLVENNSRINDLRFYKEALAKYFKEALDADVLSNAITGDQLDRYLTQFRRELDFVKFEDLQDIYALTIRLVSRTRFKGTDAEFTLSSIHQIAEENASMEVQEAALIAIVNYVVQWVALQLKVITFK